MTDAAVVRATLVDFLPVRTRSVVKIVCEIPVEMADAAQAALGGYPIPGKEPWVAIARLDPSKMREPPAADAKPKERWADMKRAKQAGIACDDPRFREWCGDTFVGPHTTADHVRARCGVASRADLDTDQEAGKRWDALYDRYLRETGQQTERRG